MYETKKVTIVTVAVDLKNLLSFTAYSDCCVALWTELQRCAGY